MFDSICRAIAVGHEHNYGGRFQFYSQLVAIATAITAAQTRNVVDHNVAGCNLFLFYSFALCNASLWDLGHIALRLLSSSFAQGHLLEEALGIPLL